MSASSSRRALSLVAFAASIVFLAGCSPEALDLGEVTPPAPIPDPAVKTKSGFEPGQYTDNGDGTYTVGVPPLTATFTGGVVAVPDNPVLVSTGDQAWLIAEGNTGSIVFNTPASSFEFFFRNEFDAPEAAPAQRGGVQCDSPPDFGNNPGEDFGAGLYARGGFNGWAGEASDPPTNFVNLGGGTYQAQFAMASGSYGFKIASEDWTIEYSDDTQGPTVGEVWTVATSGEGSGDSTVMIPSDGCYTWTITVVDGSATPAPVIEVLIEEFVEQVGGPVVCEVPDFGNNPGEAFGAEMFARGGFNGWAGEASDPPTNFVNLGNATYQAIFEMTGGSYAFKIASEDWMIEYSDDLNGPTVGEVWTVARSAAGSGDSTILIPSDGCYSWTISIVDGSETPAPVIEVLIEEFTGSGGGGAAGSIVRVYDVLDNEIETFDGLPIYRRIEVVRDTGAGETRIKRVEIENFTTLTRRYQQQRLGGGECPGLADPGTNPAEAFGAELFARGEFNDWSDPIGPPYNFINNGDGTYSAQFDLLAGSYAYKFANAGWDIQYADLENATTVGVAQPMTVGDTGLDNGLIEITEDGCYDWLITVTDDSATPAPEIELLVTKYVPDVGTPGESGIGFVAVDAFEFTAIPQTEPRDIILVYKKPDGDYSATEFVVSGDIVGGEQTLSCTPDSGFCFVVVTVLPGGSVTYSVTNNGVPDEAGVITVDPNTIVGDPLVFNFAGSNVPLTTGLPEAAINDNEVVLYYKRDDNDYEGWGLHLFPITSPDWTNFPTPGEYPYEGIDPVLGAYFIIALPGSDRLTEPGYSRCTDISVEGCDLDEFPESLGFIIHKGNQKDPGPDQFVRIAQDGNLIFVRSGVNSVSTTPPVEGGVELSGAAAHWVSDDTLVWSHGSGVDSVRLLYSADGGIREAGGRLVGVDMSFDLTPGTSPSLPNALHLQSRTPYSLPAEATEMAGVLITGQLLALGLDAEGNQVKATAVQIPLVLDDLFAEAAADAKLGVDYSGGVPALAVWAPTSNSVSVNIYDTADAETPSDTLPMDYDDTTGIWSITGTAEWDRKYYTYAVNNYVPLQSRVRDQVVTDPYSVNTTMGSAGRLVKSQMINLDDADLKPADWDTFTKPPLAAPEDIVVYETHVRSFSALDPGVLPADEGKFTAFANGSIGTAHLADMADAGLTHVHILPAFDFATVSEDPDQRVDVKDPIADLCAVQPGAQPFCDAHGGSILEALESYGPTAAEQSAIYGFLRHIDSYNWGYDPIHFNVPEGSYASDPDTGARVLEFRAMVKGLSDNGLRTVMDQVYNHTNQSGTGANAVFDKVVPGYYHRYDADTGGILRETCCDDTAAEHAMMGKFVVDSMVHWAKHYKIDGFRLDLMSFHPLATMEQARDELQALTPEEDGVDGSAIYIYGEGWNTGIAQNDSRFVAARQDNLAGTGLGSFNDRIRNEVRGGEPFESGQAHIDSQGFISGQYYDPNANNSGSTDELNALLEASDRIRVAMAGGLAAFPFTDRNDIATTGSSAGGYTDDPQEIVNYIASHDDETLWDISQYKHPMGTSAADRVRAHNLGNAILLLGQGVPFMPAGQELLRSKSMDRNTFDSGDWYTRLYFDMSDNNFAVGLPNSGENGPSLPEIEQVLAIPAADPGAADVMFASNVTKELLQIRKSTELFRLRTQADVVNRVQFHNTGSAQVPGLIVMSIDGCLTADYTPEYGSVVAVINVRTDDRIFDLYGEREFDLHPVQVSSADMTVVGAFHDGDGFHVPARTAAVFVEAQGGETVCGFGSDFAGSTAYVTGDFNNNAYINAMVPVGNTPVIEGTASVPVGADQRYRIQSSDGASINCGGPAGGGALFTPLSNGGTTFSTLACGANPEDLTLDSADETRYKFSLDTSNILNPSLVVREQTGTGFPIPGGGCGVEDAGNDNAEFFGTNMFVRGSFNNWVDPGQGGPPAAPPYQLINLGSSVFEAEFDILGGEHIFKIADADWAGPEFGSSAATVALGMTTTVPRGGFGEDLPFTAPEDGCYNFNVVPSAELDTDNAPLSLDLTATLKPQDTGEPTDTPLVRGGFNDWGETDPMTMVGDTTFEAIVSIAMAGDYEFKIASADWTIVNCGGPHQDLGFVPMNVDVGGATTISCGQNPANLLASFAEAGDYTFRIDTGNRNNPTLTIESFQGAGFNSGGIGQPTVYLKGDFNMFGLDNPTTAAGGGRLYFATVNLTMMGAYAFRFESADNVTISCGTPAGGSPDVTIGESTTISCGQGRADLSVAIPAAGDYRFQIDAGIAGSALEPVLTVNQL